MGGVARVKQDQHLAARIIVHGFVAQVFDAHPALGLLQVAAALVAQSLLDPTERGGRVALVFEVPVNPLNQFASVGFTDVPRLCEIFERFDALLNARER